ncbi:MAG: uroporphyrinogen decarboxylase family protein [Thermofilaceae archaeon]
MLSWRENYLRAADFAYPEYVPCVISVFWPVWNTYRERLEEVAERYPLLFPGFKRGTLRYEGEPGIPYTDETLVDPFGCVWRFNVKGYQGQVVKHPLEDWNKWRSYRLPDPDEGLPVEGSAKLVPWETVYEQMERAREAGALVVAPMPHGFFFQRLYYLRGFRNLLRDFVVRPPQLYELVEALTEYNMELLKRLLRVPGVDVVSFGDDLGTQTGMPISPAAFRELIYPAYRRFFSYAHQRGARVRLHTDGRVMEVAGQLLEAGVDILNIQDRVNGLESIRRELRGKVCIDLDIDRQVLIPFGRPSEVKSYVKTVIEALGSERGGLMLYAEVHPPTPLENIEALAEAMTEYMWLRGASGAGVGG